MNIRALFALVAVIACGHEEAKPATTAPTNDTGRHHARVLISKCTPVGFGFSCTAEVDGTPATLEACVGNDDKIGLTPKVAPPVTLSVDVESAPDSARYCGVLILPSGNHMRIVGLN